MFFFIYICVISALKLIEKFIVHRIIKQIQSRIIAIEAEKMIKETKVFSEFFCLFFFSFLFFLNTWLHSLSLEQCLYSFLLIILIEMHIQWSKRMSMGRKKMRETIFHQCDDAEENSFCFYLSLFLFQFSSIILFFFFLLLSIHFNVRILRAVLSK